MRRPFAGPPRRGSLSSSSPARSSLSSSAHGLPTCTPLTHGYTSCAPNVLRTSSSSSLPGLLGNQFRAACVHLKTMAPKLVEGDLLDQDVDVIVNAWNRNPFPWWLLIPQGVSAAIRKKGGNQPFRELRAHGLLPLGHAVLTSAGDLPFRAIIHVAGINLLWQASPTSVQLSTANALALARRNNFSSIAFPLIGAGTGGMTPSRVERLMHSTILEQGFDGTVVIVRFPRPVA